MDVGQQLSAKVKGSLGQQGEYLANGHGWGILYFLTRLGKESRNPRRKKIVAHLIKGILNN